jgi:hypothetical protein
MPGDFVLNQQLEKILTDHFCELFAGLRPSTRIFVEFFRKKVHKYKGLFLNVSVSLK